jgi:hypothetical protein
MQSFRINEEGPAFKRSFEHVRRIEHIPLKEEINWKSADVFGQNRGVLMALLFCNYSSVLLDASAVLDAGQLASFATYLE